MGSTQVILAAVVLGATAGALLLVMARGRRSPRRAVDGSDSPMIMTSSHGAGRADDDRRGDDRGGDSDGGPSDGGGSDGGGGDGGGGGGD